LRNLTCDFFWVHKALGLALHVAVAGGLWRLGHHLGLRTPAGFLTAALFIFSPFALEAMAWPAVVYGYPLTALFLVGYALALVSQDRVWPPLTLGLLAVMTNEQTLPLVLLLPLLLIKGNWRERLRRGSLIAGPTVLVFAAVVAHGAITGYSRASAIGTAGIGVAAENLAANAEALLWVFPGSELWRVFSEGPANPITLLGWIAVTLATVVAFWGFRRERLRTSTALWAAKAAIALGAFLLLMLPFYVQDPFFLSPRYFYMPYLALAIAIGFLAEWISRSVRIADYVVLATPLVLFGIVADGLSADAQGYRETFEQEQAIADELATTLQGNPDASHLVLVDSPWVFTDRPIFGHHIVQAFSLFWAASGAVGTLADHDLAIPVLVDVDGDQVCHRGGLVQVAGETLDASGAVFFSVRGRDQVGSLIAGGHRLNIDDGGIEFTVQPCAET
jgi:hypothetical protein